MSKVIRKWAGDYTIKAMKEYITEVVEQRVVPDFRDGLKPVQRRILFSLWQNKALSNAKFAKSARFVGDTIGKYHPHGDIACYEALVALVRDHRYPLLAGYGNFGDIDDSEAAMRYTECRMSIWGQRLFDHIEIGEEIPNYDGSLLEPLVLPSRLPILLMNGINGVAVAIRTQIPPHNLKELCNALILLCQEPNANLKQVLKHIKGPDCPYGGVLVSSPKEVYQMYRDGRGSLEYRCEWHYEKDKKGMKLVITSLAPYWKPSSFMSKVADLVEKKKIKDISVSQETSKKDGIRIVVFFKNYEMLKEHVIPLLYCRQNYHFYTNTRKVDEVETNTENLLSIMQKWLRYQRKIEKAKLQYLIDNIEIDIQKQDAKIAGMQDIDTLMNCLKKSSMEETRKAMKRAFKWNDLQIDYMLTVTLGALARANIKDQKGKLKQLKDTLAEYNRRIKNITGVIIEHLESLKELNPDVERSVINIHRFQKAHDRRTLIRQEVPELDLPVQSGGSLLVGRKDGLIKEIKRSSQDAIEFAVNTPSFYTVTKDGVGRLWTFAEVGDTRYDSLAGMVPSNVKKCVILDRAGNALTLDSNSLKGEFKTMRTTEPIAGFVGLNDEDTLIAFNKDRSQIAVLEAEDLEAVKRFQKGQKIIPRVRSNVQIARVRPQDKLYDKKGQLLLRLKKKDLNRMAFIVGPSNLTQIGKTWKSATHDETVKGIRQGKVRKVIPL